MRTVESTKLAPGGSSSRSTVLAAWFFCLLVPCATADAQPTPSPRGSALPALCRASREPCRISASGRLEAPTTTRLDSCGETRPVKAWRAVPGARNVVQAADDCIRRANGSIACRGPDRRWADLPGIADAVDLAAADGPSQRWCAVKATGEVVCWTLPSTRGASFSVPVPVEGITDAIDVEVGDAHVCAIRRGGSVTCWGNNDQGQLGRGAAGSAGGPANVTGIRDATALALGAAHSCALVSSGAVSCWGDNEVGQVGDGTVPNLDEGLLYHVMSAGTEWVGGTDRRAPVAVVDIRGATALAASGPSTCALTADGAVHCWGAYQASPNAGPVPRGSPSLMENMNGARSIVVAGLAVCSMSENGAVVCWVSSECINTMPEDE